jgi:hypothetical protein
MRYWASSAARQDRGAEMFAAKVAKDEGGAMRYRLASRHVTREMGTDGVPWLSQLEGALDKIERSNRFHFRRIVIRHDRP